MNYEGKFWHGSRIRKGAKWPARMVAAHKFAFAFHREQGRWPSFRQVAMGCGFDPSHMLGVSRRLAADRACDTVRVGNTKRLVVLDPDWTLGQHLDDSIDDWLAKPMGER